MILSLLHLEGTAPHQAPAVHPQHLLAKAGKRGEAEVRGPLVSAAPGDRPLAALADGDKLHIAAAGDGRTVAGLTPVELVRRLAELGLDRARRVKQIHLVADQAGADGKDSFAQRLADTLVAEGFHVLEVKAPRGAVRSDASGALFIRPEGDPPGAFQPSDRHLNYYAGPEVQEKHRG